jgi:dinuclear metal center YbgI/SA1388 family protein
VTTVAHVLAALDKIAPLAKAAGWDPVGLQLGDPAADVGRLGVCHEVTADVVVEAIAADLDLLITYHPLLFRQTRRLIAGRTAEGRAFDLVAGGVALGVVHTAFDVAPGGTADALAAALDLREVRGLGPAWGVESVKFVVYVPEVAADAVAAAMFEAGAGVIGNYTACSFRAAGTGTFLGGEGSAPVVGETGVASIVEEVRLEIVCPARLRDRVTAALVQAHPYEEPAFDVYDRTGNTGMIGRTGSLDSPTSLADFADRCSRVLGVGPRVAGDRNTTIGTVAVVPGSGADFVEDAAAVADVLVTGDLSHHRARQALDMGLAVIDAGHAPTERPGLRALYAAVSQIAPGVVDLTDIDPNPWKDDT